MVPEHVDENRIIRVTIRKDCQELFTHYYKGGWVGKVWQQDDEHIWIKKFATDVDGVSHYGMMERMPRNMIADIVYLD